MSSELDMMVDETMMMNHFLHGKNPFQLGKDIFEVFDDRITSGLLFRMNRKKNGLYHLHLIPSENLKNDLIDLVIALSKTDDSLSGFDESELENFGQLIHLVKKFGIYVHPLRNMHEAQVITYHLHGKYLIHEDEYLSPYLKNEDLPQEIQQGWWINGGGDYLVMKMGPLPKEETKGWTYLGPLGEKDWTLYHFLKLEDVVRKFFPVDVYEVNSEQVIIKNHVSQPEFSGLVSFFSEAKPLRHESLAIHIAEDEELRDFFYETLLVRRFWLKLQTQLYLS